VNHIGIGQDTHVLFNGTVKHRNPRAAIETRTWPPRDPVFREIDERQVAAEEARYHAFLDRLQR
jgi:hypothetical protein